MLVTFGIESALHFAGVAIDGPFQLYDALRRIGAGQRGGIDFQFFHGIGLPYLYYLPFRIFGGSFTASELTRQLTTACAYPFVLIAFLRVFTGDWRRTFALSTIVATLSIALGLWAVVVEVNSLLGVRSALPTLVPAIWMMPIRARIRTTLTGVALGASVLLGTEQGLAIIVSFTIVSLIVLVHNGDRRTALIGLLAALVTAVATIVVIAVTIGGVAGMRGALHYNLQLVPKDQYWYFGSPPNEFIRGWSSIPGLMIEEPMILGAILIGLLTFIAQIRRAGPMNDADARRHAALAMLALYGLIASTSLLGIFLPSYVHPGIRGLLLIGAVELDLLVQSRSAQARTLSRRSALPIFGLVAVASVGLTVIQAPRRTIIMAFIRSVPHVIVDHIARGEGMQMEGVWPNALTNGQKYIDTHRGPHGELPTLWSTYAGLLEARNGLFHPSSDYIIHVLGPTARAAYVERFRQVQPTLVQTVMPLYTPHETWIEQTSWDFYAELLRNYRVIGATQWSIFWERLPLPNEGPKEFWSMAIGSGVTDVDVPTPAPEHGDSNAVLIQVELAYRIRNPLGVLPIIGALPRYLIEASGTVLSEPVTVDPYTTTTRFPILAKQGRHVTLHFATYTLLPGARIEVSHVRASTIPITPANIPWLYNLAQAAAPPPISNRK
jgi:hypothetical protein